MAADRFARVRRSVERLRLFPQSGELLSRDEHSELREIYVKPCRVFFRVRKEGVRIITLVHGARDFDLEMLGDVE
jgi:plasmid stabilization system protein ParE